MTVLTVFFFLKLPLEVSVYLHYAGNQWLPAQDMATCQVFATRNVISCLQRFPFNTFVKYSAMSQSELSSLGKHKHISKQCDALRHQLTPRH